MVKSIIYNDEARRALERGMDLLAEAVAVTLGPKGRNVVLEKKFGAPQIVNDGVTIAKEIELEDEIENTGVSLIRQAASKTNDVAGDGTSTATVLAHAIVKEGLRNVAAGANPIALKRGIDKATDFLVGKIKDHAQTVADSKAIAQVGTISAGNDEEVGNMIAEAMDKVGKEGVISLEEGKSMTTELEITEGMRFDKGYISPYFVTDTERMEAVLEEPFILITDKTIALVQDLVPILEQVARQGKTLLILAEDIEKEALATLVVNRLRGVLNVAAVKAPGFGDRRKQMLEDIAVLTGGQVISEDAGLKLESAKLEMLGTARRINITKDNTTIVAEGNEAAVKSRCDLLRRQIEETESSYDKEKLQERLAKLGGGVAVVKVGAATETEMKDRKLRLEDAINATKAAVEEGIVPGGGTTLAHLTPDLETWATGNLKDEALTGALIVARALTSPLKRIAENAGQNGAVIAERVKEKSFDVGYNAASNEFVNMFEAGIVDPAKVTRSALQNAASIAGMVLTTECIVVDKPKKEKVADTSSSVNKRRQTSSYNHYSYSSYSASSPIDRTDSKKQPSVQELEDKTENISQEATENISQEDEGATIVRNPSISPKGEAIPGHEITIGVDLLYQQTDHYTTVNMPVTIANLPDDWKEIPIDVEMFSNHLLFETGMDSNQISIRRNLQSVPCEFNAVVKKDISADLDAIKVRVHFYYQTRFCGMAEREIPINRNYSIKDDTNDDSLDDTNDDSLAVSLHSSAQDNNHFEFQGEPPHLLVDILGPFGNSLYWKIRVREIDFECPGLPLEFSGYSDYPTDIESLFQKIITRLLDPNVGDHINVLHGFGEKLYECSPHFFRKTYAALRCKYDIGFPIQFICDDTTIPWEFMRPYDDNWFGNNLVVDHPVGRWTSKYQMRSHLPRGSIVTIGPKYEERFKHLNEKDRFQNISGIQAIVKIVQSRYNATDINADYDDVMLLLRNEHHSVKTPVSILLFAGHGSREDDALLSRIHLEDKDLTDTEIYQREITLGKQSHTFVIFNACETGDTTKVLGRTTGWAESFLRGKFSGFFAPFWAVYDSEAQHMIEEFLDKVLNQEKPLTVGEAAREIRETYGHTAATYLAYVYYGDVLAKFKKNN